MKKLILFSCMLLLSVIVNAQPTDFPKLTGPYLGQKPPGMTPIIFAPGFVSTGRTEFGNAFSPDGGEFYFTRFLGEKNIAAIMSTKRINDRWIPPQIVPFSGEYSDVDPVFSPDGEKLFFSSNRPLEGAGRQKDDYDIWVVTRTESGWSEPVNLGTPLNSGKDEFAPSVTRDGVIYFTSDREGGVGQMDFYCSRWKEGKYGKPENLGEAINTKYREGDGFISPDGKAFIFSAFIPGNSGSGDLYLSRQDGTGTWTRAGYLGSGVSSEGNEFTPAVTPDGKYLFFASDRTGNDDIYWVDMRSVDKTVLEHFVGQKTNMRKDTPYGQPQLFIVGGFKEKETFSDVYGMSVSDMLSGKSAVWDHGTSLPKALQGHTAVAVYNHIFVIGGLGGFTENRRAVYSPEVFSAEILGTHLGEWKRMKPLPHPLSYHASVTYKNFIIVSGGQSPADVSAVYMTSVTENGEINDWKKAVDLPKAMRGHASVMIGDRLYVIGGHDDKRFFTEAFSAPVDKNGKIGKWEYATPLPLPLVHFGAAERNGRVYILGGQDAKDSLHAEVYSAEVFGSKIGDWRRETPFPAPQSRMTVNEVDGRIIVSGGGFGWAPPVYSAVYCAEIGAGGRLGEWRKIGDLPIPLAFHAAVVVPEGRKP